MKNTKKFFLSTTTIFALTFIGCGGGSSTSNNDSDSSSSNVQALKLPSNIDIIQASDDSQNTNTQVSISSFSKTLQEKYVAPANSDYVNANTRFYVQDDSTEALKIVNMIMGFIKDTNYADFVGKGPYIAMIEEDEDKEGNQNASKGQTSSNETEELMEFILNVQRENNESSMIIDGWLTEEEDEFAQNISFKIEVTKAVSEEYPAGEFIMHIKGVNPNNNSVIMRNILQVGKGNNTTLPVSVKYKEETNHGNHGVFTSEANLLATTDFKTGQAYTKSSCYNEAIQTQGTCEYKIAYNDDYAKTDLTSFNGQADSNTTGIILDKNNYSYKIHNYGLYNKATGNAPELNAGQHILVTVDGKTYHGHAGYWGIWAGRDNLDLSNATIVDDNGTNYTIFTAPGKLEKHTQNSITLAELDGVEMNMWSNNSEKLIQWSQTDEKLYQTGTQTWGQNGPSITRFEQNIELNASNLNEWDGAWCNTLQAHFNIGRLFTARGIVQTAPTNTTTLKYFKRDTIVPGTLTSDLSLTSYNSVKYKGTVTKESIGGNTIVEEVDWQTIDWQNDNVDDIFKSNYTFSKDSMTLNAGTIIDATKNITFASDVTKNDLSNTNYNWGLHVEPLLDNNALSSVVSAIGTINMENWWKVKNNATSFYSWNTSIEDWSKLRVLQKEDGTFVSFDQPWEIAYTHSTANDRDDSNEYDGKQFRIHYDGNNLNMPWEYDTIRKTWKPTFSLKDDVELTYNNTVYVVKALEGEKLLNKVSDSYVINNGGTVPNLDDVNLSATNLDLSTIDNITFSDVPTGDLTVKVIKGVTQ